jgi:hypothetical protein
VTPSPPDPGTWDRGALTVAKGEIGARGPKFGRAKASYTLKGLT